MIVLSLLVGAAALALLLPTVTEVLARLGARSARRAAAPGLAPPKLLFLVPAHDEALLIRACVRSLAELRYPADRYEAVVIADNCTDATARIARDAGAECLERHDPALRGKPHAIAWALDRLPWAGYDAVVIIDADSVVDPEFATRLAAAAPLADKAAQGDHMVLNPAESALTRLGALVGRANHRFAYPVKQRAGLNTPLLGNGMAIGTAVLARHGWNAFSICEDWEMYAALTAVGVRIDGVPEAVVASQEARTLRQSASQRRRWTAGKITVLARYFRPLFGSREISWTQKLDALAELSAPGPALHLGLAVVLGVVTVLLHLPGQALLVGALAGSLVRPFLYIAAALRADPTPWAALGALAFVPVYTLWRLGVALGSLTMVGDRPWVRTARHAGTPAAPRPT